MVQTIVPKDFTQYCSSPPLCTMISYGYTLSLGRIFCLAGMSKLITTRNYAFFKSLTDSRSSINIAFSLVVIELYYGYNLLINQYYNVFHLQLIVCRESWQQKPRYRPKVLRFNYYSLTNYYKPHQSSKYLKTAILRTLLVAVSKLKEPQKIKLQIFKWFPFNSIKSNGPQVFKIWKWT